MEEKIDAELKALEGQKDFYADNGPRYFQLLKEANDKKSASAIEGKSLKQRVEEFASLNYLLAFKYSRDLDNCELPNPKITPKALPIPKELKSKDQRKAKKLKLLRLRAKAANALLKLLNSKNAA